MTPADVALLSLTAGDLMSRDVKTIPAGMPLREAARELARLGIHGAPVGDEAGRCVGVLSVSDLARWATQMAEPSPPPPRACSYQEILREPGGRGTVLCQLRPGACALQRFPERAGGRLVVACADPHGVGTDWQVVEVESLPPDVVRDHMTTAPVTVTAETPFAEVAWVMLHRGVQRVIVADPAGRPVGVVSASDVLAAVAREGVERGAR
jgi:CBS-domain-containing membrane protein